MSATTAAHLRHDWTLTEVKALFEQPFNDLLFAAQTVHRAHFDANRVQVSTLLSIKTGACPEDCKYCPQSGHYNTGLDKQKLMEVQKVLEAAAEAKAIGSTRFCMGAAWSAWRSASCASRKNASPASVGTAPLAVRCSSRVLSSPSRRLICWLRADCTMSRSIAARPMEPSSTMRTK